MQITQQSDTRYPIYLPPSACSSSTAVDDLQLRTGLLVDSNPKGRAAAIRPVISANASEATAGRLGDEAA
jgi:hypothetical protein